MNSATTLANQYLTPQKRFKTAGASSTPQSLAAGSGQGWNGSTYNGGFDTSANVDYSNPVGSHFGSNHFGVSYAPGKSPTSNPQSPTPTSGMLAPTTGMAGDSGSNTSGSNVSKWLDEYNKLYSSAPPLSANHILPYAESLVASRQPKPQSYYDSVREGMMSDLRNEFYGPLGTANQVAGQESAAGRLGSGVGAKVLQETVSRPFAEQQGKAYADVFQQQQEDLSTHNKWTADLLNSAKATDSGNDIEAYKASQAARGRIDEMIRGLISGEIQMSDQERQSTLDAFKSSLEREKFNWDVANTPEDPNLVSPETYQNMTADQLRSFISERPDLAYTYKMAWENATGQKYPYGLWEGY